MRPFIGEYDLTLDEKNRMLIPAEIRRAIDPQKDGEALYLVPGINRVPWMYTERFYEKLAEAIEPAIAPGQEMVAFDHIMFAMARRLEWDKAGRVLIPVETMRRSSIQREVTLIGARDHLELWNRSAWQEWQQELPVRHGDLARMVDMARQVRLRTMQQ